MGRIATEFSKTVNGYVYVHVNDYVDVDVLVHVDVDGFPKLNTKGAEHTPENVKLLPPHPQSRPLSRSSSY
jgi:hypothetical protein